MFSLALHPIEGRSKRVDFIPMDAALIARADNRAHFARARSPNTSEVRTLVNGWINVFMNVGPKQLLIRAGMDETTAKAVISTYMDHNWKKPYHKLKDARLPIYPSDDSNHHGLTVAELETVLLDDSHQSRRVEYVYEFDDIQTLDTMRRLCNETYHCYDRYLD